MRFVDFIYEIIILLLAIVSIYEYILLQKHKKQLNTYELVRKKLYLTSDKISKTNNEDEIYSIVLNTIVDLIPNATKGSVLLVKDNGNFKFQVVKGFQQELVNFEIKREEAYLYKINGFKETAIINDPREYDRINTDKDTIEGLQKINALDIYCSISAPIYLDNRLIGLINVDSDSKYNKFTEKDLELMDQIKCELELAIKNALAQNKLKYLADFDELTDLINRRTLKKEFDNEIAKMKLHKNPFCLVMIDMDNFKFLNDTYGHHFGDLVLKRFSTILIESVGMNDVVARFAGDEFIIILKECDITSAEIKMKAITNIVESTKLDDVLIQFSYGICEVMPDSKMNFDKTLTYADTKMYENKRLKNLNEK
ncbi:MAG: putative diguanylate cyclase [Anaerocolumna sp.]|jgi:diguanylate cyclase (GGDEF)-like protein|nr:putative diguanylate cyclase [Anaerocolumna sp.]